MVATTVACPVCARKVSWTSACPHRPFCSERCKLIDLGAWASNTYRVAGESSDAITEEQQQQATPPSSLQ